MCGLAGVFMSQAMHPKQLAFVEKMNEAQKHRGPDDGGLFKSDHCVLGHRRLAIIDLSQDGHQPFPSDCGRYQLIFNGEIYNYIELRDELTAVGWRFRTKTDTEVLLKAYQQYGRDCLPKLNGMFAFAVYDTKEQSLFLARDRVGVKPLYYMVQDDIFYFASELKALYLIEDFDRTVNESTVFDFLIFNRTDIFSETFTRGIKRFPKGHCGVVNQHGFILTRWWNPQDYRRDHTEDLGTIQNKIKDVCLSSVQLRMRSDVPVGVCLSGGLDSSILIGLLNNTHPDYPLKTFTASFPGHRYDETHYVRALNQKFPFQNFLTFPNAIDAHNRLDKFIYANDEPVAGPSFYTQYEVMRLAKEQGVTVLLDGQGADETFAGYHYCHGFYLLGLFKQKQCGRFLSELFYTFIRQQDNEAYRALIFQLLPKQLREPLLCGQNDYVQHDFFGEGIKKSIFYREFFDADDLNTSLVRHFQYKLEHLLRMADRNSMAFSLELREPFLDYRLIEYVLGVAGDFKISHGETKYLQKKALAHYTVQKIVSRKDKLGFQTPLEDWMNDSVWQKTILESTDYCKTKFPAIFKSDLQKRIMNNPSLKWKVVQLARWSEIFR